MKLKRLISLFLVLALCLPIAACSQDEQPVMESAEIESETEAETETEIEEPETEPPEIEIETETETEAEETDLTEAEIESNHHATEYYMHIKDMHANK